jgi:hypothetical protein
LAPALHDAPRMTHIDLDQLTTVVGGAAASKTEQPKAEHAKKLSVRRVGNTKLIGNQSLDDMYWESKPF